MRVLGWFVQANLQNPLVCIYNSHFNVSFIQFQELWNSWKRKCNIFHNNIIFSNHLHIVKLHFISRGGSKNMFSPKSGSHKSVKSAAPRCARLFHQPLQSSQVHNRNIAPEVSAAIDARNGEICERKSPNWLAYRHHRGLRRLYMDVIHLCQ